MLTFLAKRLAFMILTMLVVSFLVFLLNEWSPVAVARKILGPFASAEQVSILTGELGLDRSIFVRYGEWLAAIIQGDFGSSLIQKRPVNAILWDRLANTALLAALAFVIIVPLSMGLGILAGMREGSPLDRFISIGSIVTISIPEFASGAALAFLFAHHWQILPGVSPLSPAGGWSLLSQLVLPLTVIVLYDLGYVVRMIRASMIEVMNQPYIRTAHLKGLPFREVVLRHALRNAMITPLTVIMLQINYLLTGVVVVEALFAYPGFGRMMLEAALSKDIAVLEAGALISVFIVVVTQALSDLGYMIFNPKIRLL